MDLLSGSRRKLSSKAARKPVMAKSVKGTKIRIENVHDMLGSGQRPPKHPTLTPKAEYGTREVSLKHKFQVVPDIILEQDQREAINYS